MPVRNEQQIQTVSENSKSNAFAKLMNYMADLEVGVSEPPPLAMQLNLIWGCDSMYSTLEQKNSYADNIGRLKMDMVKPDGLGARGLFSINL